MPDAARGASPRASTEVFTNVPNPGTVVIVRKSGSESGRRITQMMQAESTLHEFRDLTSTTGGTIIGVAIIAAICFIAWVLFKD